MLGATETYMKPYLAAGTAVGIGVGIAIGFAFHHMVIGIVACVVIGAGLGFLMDRRKRVLA
jgi:hypothetical protein